MQEALHNIETRIASACRRSGRQRSEVTLIAVTKTHAVETLRKAYDLGLRDFGENRVQELLSKIEFLPSDIRWHLIGQLQSNKAKYIAPFIHLVHSIDSLSTATELSKRAVQHGRTIDILIEVNVADEETKSGISPSELPQFLSEIRSSCPALRVTGLMTVAPHVEDSEEVRPYFKALKQLADEYELKELSIGMSNDFEVAIEEGATMVRIGSALFGERG